MSDGFPELRRPGATGQRDRVVEGLAAAFLPHQPAALIARPPFYGSLRISRYQHIMEKRGAPRKPVLMSGAIEFAGSVINCLISNISISGAALEVNSPNDIPERFNLAFKADDTHIPCRVIWRQEDRIGVAFD
jgi:PilZ domain